MAFALTHFVGSGLFNRALRYWARTATDAARQIHEGADGLRLSEYGLVPIKKGASERRGDRVYQNTEVLGFCCMKFEDHCPFPHCGLARVFIRICAPKRRVTYQDTEVGAKASMMYRFLIPSRQ